MKIAFAGPGVPKAGTIVVGVADDRTLTAPAAALDRQTGGALTRAMTASRFTGKRDQFLSILAPANLSAGRVLLAGLGKLDAVDALQLEALGGGVHAQLAATGETEAAVLLDGLDLPKIAADRAAAAVAFGCRLRSYRFDKYRTRLESDKKPALAKLTVHGPAAAAAKKAFATLDAVADGVFETRDLVSEPGNVVYPETLAAQARELESLGVEVEVLDEKKLQKLGAGALLAVGRGSARPPRLIVLRWQGAKDKDAAPVAFVGKGITFDTGGISIKPAGGMEDMKWDMAGAGAVIGALKALAGRKAKANVVGIVAAAENMPDGNATRPGDIVASLSGQTIEINNTDAEGRLVLADALSYVQERFKPSAVIDLATLTGAIIIALGHEQAGLFSNDDELAAKLQAAGAAVGERLWRMPLADGYNKLIDSDAADVKNISGSRDAGSVVAAQFLQRFVKDTKWAHLDIAGMAWATKDSATVPKGATAFGVRLLDRFVADTAET
ncbi:MAG TPA: leucyl aminopeptidase [Stellaceae bacterium]|nr:leucyl aminopeptidase [Stellaceae bacterium]